jgi:N-acetylglutamate synthase-like GNAT family acetyltransferase
MKIERVSKNNISDVYCCLVERKEFYKDDIAESLDYMKEKIEQGWLAYAVYDDAKKSVGMAILLPASDPLSPVAGKNIYYFHCLDINKELRRQGIAKQLVEKITEDVKALGAKGLAVDSFGEYWMPDTFFTKIGFEVVKKFPYHYLLLKKITNDVTIEYIEMPYKGDLPKSGIQVDIQHWTTCPFMLNNYKKVREMVEKLAPNATIRERIINTKEDIEKWGGSGVFVNGKSVSAGPVSEEDLKKAINEAKVK